MKTLELQPQHSRAQVPSPQFFATQQTLSPETLQPNLATVVIGDAMIVIAARNLKCGDELTVAYFSIFRPLKERRSSMLHSWNFVCTCPRCVLEEKLEDSLGLVAQTYSLRETEAALTIQVLHIEKQHSQDHWNKTWSPYSVIDLAQLAEYIEKVLYQERLSRDERNWIRASFLSALREEVIPGCESAQARARHLPAPVRAPPRGGAG